MKLHVPTPQFHSFLFLLHVSTEPADYTSVVSTLTFTSSDEQRDIPVALATDDLFEDSEHFFANLVLGTTTVPVQIDLNQAQLDIMDSSGTV